MLVDMIEISNDIVSPHFPFRSDFAKWKQRSTLTFCPPLDSGFLVSEDNSDLRDIVKAFVWIYRN